MTGLGLVDQVFDNVFGANAITKHLADYAGATHGALHLFVHPLPKSHSTADIPSTIEGLLAGAFTYPKLKDTNFAYPFAEADTPMQYAHKRLGNEALSKKHTYSIMADEGRMDSFNLFMVQKFFKELKAPDRIKNLGYDLDAAISSTPHDSVAVVDIGGGHGHTLLAVKETYPHLSPDKLIVQDFYATVDTIPGLTLMKYNFKDTAPQPVQGAHIYCLQHILHNQPDLEAVALLQKTASAMNQDSRLLIIEVTKNANNAAMHAAMIAFYGGRERSSDEWKLMAAVSGLVVTFESYPEFGECLVEMRKIKQ